MGKSKSKPRGSRIPSLKKALKATKPALQNLDGLSQQERDFAAQLLGGKSKTAAAKAVAAAPIGNAAAQSLAEKMLNKPAVERAIIKALEAEGITDAFLAKNLKSGFKAMRPVVVMGSLMEVDDHKTRLDYINTALKIRGDLGEQGAGAGATSVTYRSFIDADDN